MRSGSGRRLYGSVKVDGDIDAGTFTVAQSFETLRDLVHELLALEVFERRPGGIRGDLHGVDAGRGIDLAVDADPVARRTAEQFVNRHAVDFSLDIPERLVDPTEDGRLDRPSAIERTAFNRLPVEHDAIGVLADQVTSDLERSGGARPGIVFEHLAPADDAGIRRDLHEHPGILENERFHLRDLDAVVRPHRGRVGAFGGKQCVEAEQGSRRESAPQQGPAADLRSWHDNYLSEPIL